MQRHPQIYRMAFHGEFFQFYILEQHFFPPCAVFSPPRLGLLTQLHSRG